MITAQVRPVDASQWPVLKQIRLQALADEPTAFASTYEREVGFPDSEWQNRAANGTTFLAWADDAPVGLVALVQHGAAADERHLVSMWVAAEWRGSTVARDLVAAVASAAVRDGARALTLWVADPNARARRFYERLGFIDTGDRQPLPSAPDVGERRLRCELTTADWFSAVPSTGKLG